MSVTVDITKFPEIFRFEDALCLGIATGNPGVSQPIPVPVPAETRTRD